jgi:hypothetical protein
VFLNSISEYTYTYFLNIYIRKHKPYAKPVKQDSDVIPSLQEQNQESPDTSDEKKTPPPEEEKKPNEEEEVEEKEEKEYLLGPYLGQYVVYTSPSDAWLL